MIDWDGIGRIWFLTWTTYGTWQPSDERGLVSHKFEGHVPERRNNEPGRPYDDGRGDLRRIAESKLDGDPVRLTRVEAGCVRRQLEETARHRGWPLLAGAIMANHVHLVVGVPDDPDPSALLRDFKSDASRALNRRDGGIPRSKWWTEQGSTRKVAHLDNPEALLQHVRNQPHALEVWFDATFRPGEREASAPVRMIETQRERAWGVGPLAPLPIQPDRGLTPPARLIAFRRHDLGRKGRFRCGNSEIPVHPPRRRLQDQEQRSFTTMTEATQATRDLFERAGRGDHDARRSTLSTRSGGEGISADQYRRLGLGNSRRRSNSLGVSLVTPPGPMTEGCPPTES
ncbi:transposase [Aquisphaera insulae]|uniref:transposase n=1 Tax=Aquisphaera insulae TaxID=2712864 RepID=UPI0013EB66DD|nr:transposase [Aquisphaera insulae]